MDNSKGVSRARKEMIAPFSRAVLLGMLLSIPVWTAVVATIVWLLLP